jgi:hypothetical protein
MRTPRPLRREAPTVSAWGPKVTTSIQQTSACQVSPWRMRVGTATPHRATAIPFGAYRTSGFRVRLPRKYTRCIWAIPWSPLGRSWMMPMSRATVVSPMQRTRWSPGSACRSSGVGERPLGRESAAVSWASEPTAGCALGDTASCGVRLRAMDLHSARPCMLQSIIHDDGAVQKVTIVMSAGGCHKYNEPGHREVSEETRTSSPCPVQPVLWTVP